MTHNVKMSTTARLLAGTTMAMRGLKAALTAREVRRTYVLLSLATAVIAAILDTLGIWAVWTWTESTAEQGWWAPLWLFLLRIAGIGLVVVAAPILAISVVNLVFPMLAERVFFAAFRSLAPARADELRAAPGLPFLTGVWVSMIRSVRLVVLSAGIFLLAFIPGLGTIAGPLLQSWLAARSLGWELLDPYFSALSLSVEQQRDAIAARQATIVGFALPFVVIMAIPLVGPWFYGVAQAAAATLVFEALEPHPEPST